MNAISTQSLRLKIIVSYSLAAGIFFAASFGLLLADKLPELGAFTLPAVPETISRSYIIAFGALVAFCTAAIICAFSLVTVRKIICGLPEENSERFQACLRSLEALDFIPLFWLCSSLCLLLYALASSSPEWSPFEIFLLIPLWCGVTAPLALARFGFSVYKSMIAPV